MTVGRAGGALAPTVQQGCVLGGSCLKEHTSIREECPGSLPKDNACTCSKVMCYIQGKKVALPMGIFKELTSAVPARATNAERKLKNKALDTVKPDRTRIPKSPTLTEKEHKV